MGPFAIAEPLFSGYQPYSSPSLLTEVTLTRSTLTSLVSRIAKLKSPTLWRSIQAPRGGRRGLATKVRRVKGISQGCYQGTYPFITGAGFEYAKQWKFQISNSVLQGATVWEVESSSSGEEVQILERQAAKARPTPKARPTDHSANSLQGSS